MTSLSLLGPAQAPAGGELRLVAEVTTDEGATISLKYVCLGCLQLLF